MTTLLPLNEFQELLTCSLCTGYYRDAHTILECMHTFCKSCILVHFHENNLRGSIQCPQCNVSLGLYGHLASKMIYDRDLQSIVDKVFPQFLKMEKVTEEKFYADQNIPLKAPVKKHEREEEMVSSGPPLKRAKSAVSSRREEEQEETEVAPAPAATKPKKATKAPQPPVEIPVPTYVEPNVDFIAKLVPAKDPNPLLLLSPLTKRLCKATTIVRVFKLKSFVHKRLPEEEQKGIEPGDIKLTYNGTLLSDEMKLGILGDVIEVVNEAKGQMEFEYSLAKPRAVAETAEPLPEAPPVAVTAAAAVPVAAPVAVVVPPAAPQREVIDMTG